MLMANFNRQGYTKKKFMKLKVRFIQLSLFNTINNI
ncbi:unnamed protein product [Paramecium sonneborni]|uniref:Uncharacterized protein n=1 Tax=Paramecium sonneborni TaxID=65129 RepID=A0A8S1MDH2_9CILI|nr:unnamed protein product [Paramecium sonneborni]